MIQVKVSSVGMMGLLTMETTSQERNMVKEYYDGRMVLCSKGCLLMGLEKEWE